MSFTQKPRSETWASFVEDLLPGDDELGGDDGRHTAMLLHLQRLTSAHPEDYYF
jgi:hypothetical protein